MGALVVAAPDEVRTTYCYGVRVVLGRSFLSIRIGPRRPLDVGFIERFLDGVAQPRWVIPFL